MAASYTAATVGHRIPHPPPKRARLRGSGRVLAAKPVVDMARAYGAPPPACGKKRLSKGKAEGIIKAARRSRNSNRQECRSYFCCGCGCWHTSATEYRTPTQRQADYPVNQ
jgi:hypothetical protein